MVFRFLRRKGKPESSPVRSEPVVPRVVPRVVLQLSDESRLHGVATGFGPAVLRVRVPREEVDPARLSPVQAVLLELLPHDPGDAIMLDTIIEGVDSTGKEELEIGLRLGDLGALFRALHGEWLERISRRREFRVTPSINMDVVTQILVGKKRQTPLTHDLSVSGIGLCVPRDKGALLKPGQILKMSVCFPGDPKRLSVRGQIVHVSEDPDSETDIRVGLSLDDDLDGAKETYDSRLRGYTMERQREDRQADQQLLL